MTARDELCERVADYIAAREAHGSSPHQLAPGVVEMVLEEILRIETTAAVPVMGDGHASVRLESVVKSSRIRSFMLPPF